MKKKLVKILGVGLTITVLASLIGTATPVTAGVNYWSSQSTPGEGYLYGWDRALDILAPNGLGPMAQGPTGELFIYSGVDGATAANDYALLKSTTGGYSFSELTGTPGSTTDPTSAVVDWAISPEEASVVYYTDGTNIMKSIDGGSTWAPLAMTISGGGTLANVTSIDCALIGGSYLVVAGAAGALDEAYLYDESKIVPSWEALSTPGAGTDPVLDIALSPKFVEATNRTYIAVTTDGTDTFINTKVGGAVWNGTRAKGTVLSSGTTSVVATDASIAFPETFDYSASPILFVGLTDAGTGGDVYMVILGASSTNVVDTDAGGDIASLDVSGTHVLAGADSDSKVYYSTDSGDTWETIYKQPTGEWDTYVALDADFSNSGEAWAASGGYDGGVSHTTDYCQTWNQICMINTATNTINDLSVISDSADIYLAVECDVTTASDSVRALAYSAGSANITVTAGSVTVTPSTGVTVATAGSSYIITFPAAYGYAYISATTAATTATYATLSGTVSYSVRRDIDGDATCAAGTMSLPDTYADNDSIWRYDTNWERVFSQTISTSYGAADRVSMSPDYDNTSAVFACNIGGTKIWRSIDGGQRWKSQTTAVPAAIQGWLVIDQQTLLTGMLQNVNKTTNNGLSWGSPINLSTTSGNDIVEFAMKDGKIMAGSDLGYCYNSSTLGDTWTAMYGPGSTTNWPSGGTTSSRAIVAIGDDGKYYATQPAGGVWRHRTSVYGDRIDNKDTATDDSAEVMAGTGIGEYAGTLYVIDNTSGNGLMRCLDPQDDVTGTSTDLPYFENVIHTSTATITGTCDKLWITEGSNGPKIWTIYVSTTGGYYIYVYEDQLAVPVEDLEVTMDPLVANKAELSWTTLTDADSYQWQIDTREDFTGGITDGGTGVIHGNVFSSQTLTPGRTYYVRVRGDAPVLTRWSESATFTVDLGTPGSNADWTAPAPGAQDISTNPVFQWAPITGATGYEFQLTEDPSFYDTPSLLLENATVTTNTYVAQPLAYGTTYYWRVRAIGTDTMSSWTNGVFTTMAEPEEEEPIVITVPGETEFVEGPTETIVIQEQIPTVLLWVVVAIGAVLIIALIILIARTRRVA